MIVFVWTTLLFSFYLENIPIITISDIREIVNEQNSKLERKENIERLQKKIDKIVEEGQWDFDDIFIDHNYSNTSESIVFESVVYFLTG